jgi:ATP-binding cassette subfamily B protein
VTIDSHEKRSSWQRSIAHVPQNIYLADCSIGENIAFGIPPDKIDFERVRKAARKAEIAEYIENSSGGYSALAGERGVWLSGGQQQRIGIARALYKDASVIVFDEATSALDNQTESTLMQTIEGLSREVTMFIVAHRLTSLKNCDFLIKLDGGKVFGPYEYSEIINLEEGG